MEHGEVTIVANASALTSLAGYLLVLAQEGVPSGNHIHLDEGDPLELGSISLILEKQ